MRWAHYLAAAALAGCCRASVGDNLPEFRDCVAECVPACSAATDSPYYLRNTINTIAGTLFLWDCPLECSYQCQQRVTSVRHASGLPMVQFYGKWPFRRVLGITEMVSTLFSVANLWVNVANLQKVTRHYRRVRHQRPQSAVMLRQYLVLLWVSVVGWAFSTVFHVRDVPLTETLDYLGAGAIIVANLNAVCVRSFDLHLKRRTLVRQVFQAVLVVVLLAHYARLLRRWDYLYNLAFNLAAGLAALVLWVGHLWRTHRTYQRDVHRYNSSIHLVPHETRLLAAMNHVGLLRAKYIPLIPVALNVYLVLAVSLEMVDFEPWWRLVDAHALWHLCTVFPPMVWYDWNIWDLEMAFLNGAA